MRAVEVTDYMTAGPEFKQAIGAWFEAHSVPITDVVRYTVQDDGAVRYERYLKDAAGKIDPASVDANGALLTVFAIIQTDSMPPLPDQGTWIEYPDGVPS